MKHKHPHSEVPRYLKDGRANPRWKPDPRSIEIGLKNLGLIKPEDVRPKAKVSVPISNRDGYDDWGEHEEVVKALLGIEDDE